MKSVGDGVKRVLVGVVGPGAEHAGARAAYQRATSALPRGGLVRPESAARIAELAQAARDANRRLVAVCRDPIERDRLRQDWDGLSSLLRAARRVGGFGTDEGEGGVREPRGPGPGGPAWSAAAEAEPRTH